MISSLKAQTYQNLQIILVDDGSNDNTAEILKQFQTEDSRVEYYYQENSGVSSARNLGLTKAKGEKIFFFDSDDTFEPRLVEKVVTYAQVNQIETVLYGYANCVEGKVGTPHEFKLHGIYEGNATIIRDVMPSFLGHSFENIEQWLEGNSGLREGKEHTALWRVMLDANVIRQNQIQFDCNLSLGEDTKFIKLYLLCTNSIGVLEETLYYLTIRPGSANVTSNENAVLMTENKIKLIEARKEIDAVAKEKGFATNHFWEGTMILSAVQLAIRLSNNCRNSKHDNKRVYLDYLNLPDVKRAIHNFSPRTWGIKVIPFMLLKWKWGGKFCFICAE